MLTIWGVAIPRTVVCPGHSSPFDAFADAYFARHPVSMWLASRGFGGKTQMLAVLTLTEGALLGAQATILGGSGAQSLRVHEASLEAWHAPHAPRYLLARDQTKYDTVFTNGAWIRSLMASQTSVRGPHPQRLRLDEIDEMELSILEAAQGQPMTKRGIQTQTVLSSTHQYPDRTVSEMLKRARDKSFPVFRWCVAVGAKVMTGRGEVPIEEVTTEDVVYTHEGWRKVQHVTFMGYKETVAIHTSKGRILRCTPDHLILTETGWQEGGGARPVAGEVREVKGVRLYRAVGPAPLMVEAVEQGPVLPVYDIGVEEAHSFVAEGVVVHNCYKETSNPVDGWLTTEEVDRKRSEVSQSMWKVEYELQEPSYEGRAIDTDSVMRAFDARLGTFEGVNQEKCQTEKSFEHPGPRRKWPYVTAVDWAARKDWTIVAVFRTNELPWRCVCWMRIGRMPWPVMIHSVEKIWREYGGKLIHDSTGIGDVVKDLISGDRANIIDRVITQGRARMDLFSEYVSGIESGDLLYPRIVWAFDEHRFCSLEDLFGKGHPPDSIVTGALAWSARPRSTRPMNVAPIGLGKTPGWTLG